MGCYTTALILLLISGILVATGRHKLRAEVNLGVTVGSVTSLLFAALALGMTANRKARLGWLHWTCVGVTFGAISVLNAMLLLLVAGNTLF